jgi:cytoskeletal protein RodZ
MSRPHQQQLVYLAALGIIGLGIISSGCGNNKPPETTAPGSEHVAAEKQDERDTATVHTPSDSPTGAQTNPPASGNQ